MLDFRERLRQAERMLLDGAMGTELEARGFDTSGPAWSARALVEAPELVLEVHSEHLEAGAEILTANTFRTQQRALGKAEWGGKALELSRKAMGLAKEAVRLSANEVYVAGSMAPLEDCYEPQLVPEEEELTLEHTLHAENLALAGADLLLIETMNTAREARAAAEAAQRTGLPFGVSFVCDDAGRLLSGESLQEAVEELRGLQPAFLGVNCVPAGVIDRALGELLTATTLPVAVYGNIGHTADFPAWHETKDYSDEAYAEQAAAWLSAQVKILGGCCGTSRAHIAALAALKDKELS